MFHLLSASGECLSNWCSSWKVLGFGNAEITFNTMPTGYGYHNAKAGKRQIDGDSINFSISIKSYSKPYPEPKP